MTGKDIDSLRDEAANACQFRGHDISHLTKDWKVLQQSPERTVEQATCPTCGKLATIDDNPPPNGIDISGAAVATCCKPKK